jgi:hypothetical protein
VRSQRQPKIVFDAEPESFGKRVGGRPDGIWSFGSKPSGNLTRPKSWQKEIADPKPWACRGPIRDQAEFLVSFIEVTDLYG